MSFKRGSIMAQRKNYFFTGKQAEETVLAFFCFGPGGASYREYFEAWIKSNHESVGQFVILTDSAFESGSPAKKPGGVADLIDAKNQLEEQYHVNIAVVDIRKSQSTYANYFLYVDWLINNVSVTSASSDEKRPAYAFVADSSRYIGLLVLSDLYPNAKKIFIAEADTHGIRKNFLGEKHDIEQGLKFFGDDRALILLRNDNSKAKKHVEGYCRAYENIYLYILNKQPLNFSLSDQLIISIMQYQGNKDDDSLCAYLTGDCQAEYAVWSASHDRNIDNFTHLLIGICGEQSRYIFVDKGIGDIELSNGIDSDQNVPSLKSEEGYRKEDLMQVGAIGYWHDALGNWSTQNYNLESPDSKFLMQQNSYQNKIM